jgi:hypothetical protein
VFFAETLFFASRKLSGHYKCYVGRVGFVHFFLKNMRSVKLVGSQSSQYCVVDAFSCIENQKAA